MVAGLVKTRMENASVNWVYSHILFKGELPLSNIIGLKLRMLCYWLLLPANTADQYASCISEDDWINILKAIFFLLKASTYT